MNLKQLVKTFLISTVLLGSLATTSLETKAEIPPNNYQPLEWAFNPTTGEIGGLGNYTNLKYGETRGPWVEGGSFSGLVEDHNRMVDNVNFVLRTALGLAIAAVLSPVAEGAGVVYALTNTLNTYVSNDSIGELANLMQFVRYKKGYSYHTDVFYSGRKIKYVTVTRDKNGNKVDETTSYVSF